MRIIKYLVFLVLIAQQSIAVFDVFELVKKRDINNFRALSQRFHCDINNVDKFGNTILMYAIFNRDVQMVNYILNTFKKKINLFLVNSSKETIFHIAAHVGFDISKPISRYYKSTVLLEHGLKSKNVALVDLILKNNINAYAAIKLYLTKKAGSIPLLYYVYYNQYFSFFNILLYDPQNNIDQTDGIQRTSLFYAAQVGNMNLLIKLIDAGADVNKNQKDGTSPLSIAVIMNNHSIVKKLLENGAFVNVQDVQKRIPLMYAVACNDFENVTLLLRYGADCFLSDQNGKNVFDYIKNENMKTHITNIIEKKRYEEFFKRWSYWKVHTSYCFRSF